jgi:hypothetical protein
MKQCLMIEHRCSEGCRDSSQGSRTWHLDGTCYEHIALEIPVASRNGNRFWGERAEKQNAGT